MQSHTISLIERKILTNEANAVTDNSNYHRTITNLTYTFWSLQNSLLSKIDDKETLVSNHRRKQITYERRYSAAVSADFIQVK